MTYTVLGIHGFSADSNRVLHDTGATLTRDGKILAAVNEERLSRVKKDGSFPFKSIDTVLNITKVGIDEIDLICFADERPVWQLEHIYKYAFETFHETGVFVQNYLSESLERTKEKIDRRLPKKFYGIPVDFVEHHIAHAASAFFTSPWKEAAVISLDGMGDYSIGGVVGKGEGKNLSIMKRTNGFYSPGIFYMMITDYLGFRPGHHEGKVMGLAAYGDPDKAYPVMEDMIKYDPTAGDFCSGVIPEALNRFSLTKDSNYTFEVFRQMLDGFDRKDIATAAQKRLEDVVLPFIKDAIQVVGYSDIALAGGIFANVRLNQKIREMEEVSGVFIHPAMNDSGLATGAALYETFKRVDRPVEEPPSVFLGPEYFINDIQKCLLKNHIPYEILDNVEHKIAETIHDKKIVGHFHGRMEYGPRALGNRSILVRATDEAINRKLNDRLRRTEFMPFAPAILEEYAEKYLVGYKRNHHAARFMTMNYNVTDEFREMAPAAVHIDGTARPQVVRKQDNPRLHAIIKEYQILSGIPAIINTSFNMHEEPIVCSVNNAIKAYNDGAVDLLFLENICVGV